MTVTLAEKFREYEDLASTLSPTEPDAFLAALTSAKAGGLDLRKVEIRTVAEQLTMMDSAFFLNIHAMEFRHCAWAKPATADVAPNILDYIAHFNYVSNWVVSSILEEAKLKKRARVMARFVSIAEELRTMGSFNAMMAVMSALSTATISRLTKTKAALPRSVQALHRSLKEVIASRRSFSLLRKATHEAERPVIPFLGLYLTDLTMTSEGNPDYFGPNKLPHWRKFDLLGRIVQELASFQEQPFEFGCVACRGFSHVRGVVCLPSLCVGSLRKGV